MAETPPRWRVNLWPRLLSLVLAVFTWLYVQSERVEEERVNAQIAWTLPEGLVATEPLPTTAFLTVRGTRGAVNLAHDAVIRLVVDGSAFGVGPHTAELGEIPAEGLPNSVERLSTAPSTVQFTLEPVTERSVRIEAVVVGEPGAGFAIEGVTIDPGVVHVRGPRSAMSSLREVPTRPIDVSSLSESSVRDAPLDLPRSVELVDNTPIQARITVVSKSEQRRVEDVPVFVWNDRDEQWAVRPDRVSVLLEGPASRVHELGAARIAAFVYLPDPVPDRPEVEVWFGPTEGPRIEVLHPSNGVTAVSTNPPSVVVTRR
ncbi:MAG: CdaR family protein [Myxococcota bacterium]